MSRNDLDVHVCEAIEEVVVLAWQVVNGMSLEETAVS